MIINALDISHFRNLNTISIPCSPHFNVFYGANGAGKTSLLEAIYTLSHAKSFRSHNVKHIIQHEYEAFQLHCELVHNDDSHHKIGLERSLEGGRKVRLDGETVNAASSIAKLLPIQLITIDSYRYFTDGPKHRREFLDWGVFHVKHAFVDTWKQFQRILKQRNAALKARAPISEIEAWNTEFIGVSNLLTQLRTEYASAFIPIYDDIIKQILPTFPLKIQLFQGWEEGEALENILKSNYYKDLGLGYTSAGPQRADFQVTINDIPIQEELSQGQQKLASYALQLAQGALYQRETNRAPIYLIDDLPSELDPKKRAEITTIIKNMQAQVFITGITLEDLRDAAGQSDASVFHIINGQITQNQVNAMTV